MSICRLRCAVLAAFLGACLAGVTFAASGRKAVPATSGVISKEIRDAAEAMRQDGELSEYATAVLYWTMTGWHRPEFALKVFTKAGATPVVRQGLLTQDWRVVADAASYFERTGDVAALPDLVNALERYNYPFATPTDATSQHSAMRQELVRAIGVVTGLNKAAWAILPENPVASMDTTAVSQFLTQVRQWAKEHGIELYPPAEIQLPPRSGPAELEEQVGWLIRRLDDPKPLARQVAAERLRRVRDRIDAALKEHAGSESENAPATERP